MESFFKRGTISSYHTIVPYESIWDGTQWHIKTIDKILNHLFGPESWFASPLKSDYSRVVILSWDGSPLHISSNNIRLQRPAL